MSLLSPNLQAFLAVNDAQTVHGAAKLIGIGQTGVTQRIRSLEKELSYSLFTRSRKGMLLTKEGEVLLQYCLKIKELNNEFSNDLNLKNSLIEIQMNIAGPSSVMRSRVIPNTSKLTTKYSNLTYNYLIDDNESALIKLKKGICHLAILRRDEVVSEIDSKLLTPEKYFLVGCTKWKNRKLEDIVKNERIVDFNKDDLFTFNFLKKYNLLKRANKERHFVNNTDALCNLVASGVGYSVLSEKFIQTVKNRGLSILSNDKFYNVDFALCWYPRSEMPDYFKDMIKVIK